MQLLVQRGYREPAQFWDRQQEQESPEIEKGKKLLIKEAGLGKVTKEGYYGTLITENGEKQEFGVIITNAALKTKGEENAD